MTEIAYPPPALRNWVSGTESLDDFQFIGDIVAGHARGFGLVAAGCRVLDIGCGCGRVARHFLDDPLASYAGVDRSPDMVAWCQQVIGGTDPRFRFSYIPVRCTYEAVDGSKGSVDAAEFRFPFANGSFDSFLLSSVFTHMEADGIEAYLTEMHRMGAPGARAMCSVFVLENPHVVPGHPGNFEFPNATFEAMFRRTGFSAEFHQMGGAQDVFLLTRR